GASSGIGSATARHLAERGAKVVLGARRTDRLEALCREIGDHASFVRCDVTRREDLAGLVQAACDRHGGLDVLVSNAGVALVGKIDDLRIDDWNEMIDVNLRGVLHGITAALPVFRAQQRGHFVNVVSTAELRIVPTQVVYAATKNAVRTISEGLRQEAGPNLRVTVVSPGFVKSELIDRNLERADPAVREALAKRAEAIAISPDAIARAIAFAIEQPADVDVGDIVVRPTAQD
ncbi:MAG TPA: SDR family oxidoreductase, partial [Kofleriaceae bacterium]